MIILLSPSSYTLSTLEKVFFVLFRASKFGEILPWSKILTLIKPYSRLTARKEI